MKKILVTGANGQLGTEIQKLANSYRHFNFVFTDVDTLNICDKKGVRDFVRNNDIRYIINCAAYTAVDRAEDESILCKKINDLAVRNLAEAARDVHGGMIHVSTDYVFNGRSCMPYTEQMPPKPVSVYGKTKAQGERALFKILPQAIVLRTAWLYSPYGNNFVKTMIRLGQERESLNVVYDQIGTPTYAGDLARAIMIILERTIDREHNKSGIYHFTNEGVCSWYDFARKVMELWGITTCQVQPISTSEYPTRATRPHYSVLSKAKIKQAFPIEIPHWEDSLKNCIGQLKEQNK